MTSLAAALESLDIQLAAAERRVREVRDRTRKPDVAGADLLRPLTDYHRAVAFKQREPNRAEETRLTQALLSAVTGDGVSLVPVDTHVPAKGLRVLDRRGQRELARVQDEANAIRRERNRFLADHGDELAAEAKRAEFAKLQEAWKSGDVDRLRERLTGAAA